MTPDRHHQAIGEAATEVLTWIEGEDREYIRSLSEEERVTLHFSLGNDIRNKLALWEKVKDPDHPFCGKVADDISTMIIQRVRERLQAGAN